MVAKMIRKDTTFNGFLDSFLIDENYEKPEEIIQANQNKKEPTIYRINLGIDKQGNIITCPLFQSRILICGYSGSGKSIVANQILSEIFTLPPQLRITALIDCKGGIEIAPWAQIADGTARNLEYANRLIRNVYLEMIRRQNECYQQGIKTIRINANNPLIILFVDELAEIAEKSKNKDEQNIKNEAMENLVHIFRLGRATGIVPIVCLQSPLSEFLGEVKRNINITICGRTRSQTDTGIIFGKDQMKKYPAHELPQYWFYFVSDNFQATFKTPYIPSKNDLDENWAKVITICDREKDKIKGRGKFLYFNDHPINAKQDKTKDQITTNSEPKKRGRKSKRGRPKKQPENIDFNDFIFN